MDHPSFALPLYNSIKYIFAREPVLSVSGYWHVHTSYKTSHKFGYHEPEVPKFYHKRLYMHAGAMATEDDKWYRRLKYI